jgi:hypothetical protein
MRQRSLRLLLLALSWCLVVCVLHARPPRASITRNLSQANLEDEAKHIQFVRGLKQRGYHDLALEHLNSLVQGKPAVSPQLKRIIPLEIALLRLDLSNREADQAVRDAHRAQALADFNKFVKNPDNKGHPLLGTAWFELGRISSEQARGKLVEMRVAGDKGDQAAQNRHAEDSVRHFTEASQAFKEASDLLRDVHNNLDIKQKEEKAQALTNYLRSLYLQGQMLFEKNEVFDTLKNIKESDAALQEAAKIFEGLSKNRDHAYGWMGLAWYGRSKLGFDNAEMERSYKDIQGNKAPIAAQANQLVSYFQIIQAYQSRQDVPKVRKMLESWLGSAVEVTAPGQSATVQNLMRTSEGQHIYFMLANTILRQQADLKLEKRDPKAMKIAQDIFDKLELQGGEYAVVARNHKFDMLLLAGKASTKSIGELTTFDELYLRASMEKHSAIEVHKKAGAAQGDEKKKGEELAKTHQRTMFEAARRSIPLMPETTKNEDWETIMWMLYAGYYSEGDALRCIVILEGMLNSPRSQPATKRDVAMLLLDFYPAAMRETPTRETVLADSSRLIRAAEYLIKHHDKDKSADSGRYVLGQVYKSQAKYLETIDAWSKVTVQHPKHADVWYEAADLAWRYHLTQMRKQDKPLKTSSPQLQQALELYQRALKAWAAMPPAALRENPTPVIATVSFAQIQRILGNQEDALKLLDPLADKFSRGELPPNLSEEMTAEIISAALRLALQKQNLKRAMELLDSLRTAAANNPAAVNTIINEIGQSLQGQIDLLEKQGEPAKAQLEQTRKNFRSFLEQMEKDPKITPEMRLWVGINYKGLGDLQQAVKVFSSLDNPGASPAPPNNADDKAIAAFNQVVAVHQSKLMAYRRAVFFRVSCLRELAEAETDMAKRDTAVETATATLKEALTLLGKHPQLVAEEIKLLMIQERVSGPNGAIVKWDKLRTDLGPHLAKGGIFKEVHDDACYNLIVCRLLEAIKLTNPKIQQETLQSIVKMAVTFEDTIPEIRPKINRWVKENRIVEGRFVQLYTEQLKTKIEELFKNPAKPERDQAIKNFFDRTALFLRTYQKDEELKNQVTALVAEVVKRKQADDEKYLANVRVQFEDATALGDPMKRKDTMQAVVQDMVGVGVNNAEVAGKLAETLRAAAGRAKEAAERDQLIDAANKLAKPMMKP